MIWTILGALVAVYLLLGLIVATLRILAHDMPWPLFVFTVLLWPTLWFD